jgi:hypothetical protein
VRDVRHGLPDMKGALAKGALAIVHEAVDNLFNRIVVCGELSRRFD